MHILLVFAAMAATALDGISFDAPKTWPCDELTRDGVRALWFEGEAYNGKPTRVFAYIALPERAGEGKKVPGMVLAHGGGGTAYASWARTWAARGYAAIVPDNCGGVPLRAPGGKWILSGSGGPAGWGRFELGLKSSREQWPYHAVGAIVRAHSLLRSLPEVDAERTGITGVSWGGYLTMLAAATDARFKLAMPVYACGYYDQVERYSAFYKKDADINACAFARWVELFDSKHYAPRLNLPVFWFASTNDKAFPFDLLQRTLRLPAKRPGAAVRVRMKHSHGPAGENMPEAFMFADHILNGAPALPCVGVPEVASGELRVKFDARGHKLSRVDLNWCSDSLPAYETRWETVSFPVPQGSEFIAKVPDGATRAYVNFVLDRQTGEEFYPEALVSSYAVEVDR